MIAIGSYFVIIVSVMGMPYDLFEDKKEFFQYILNEHNNYRKDHNSDDLILKDFTTRWASKILIRWLENTEIIPNEPGVNTFSIKLSEISDLDAELAKKIVAEWYETGKDYNYDVEPTSNTADPFTQIVWQYSQHLGVAIRKEEDKLYGLAYYFPFGNDRGKYIENVKRPLNIV